MAGASERIDRFSTAAESWRIIAGDPDPRVSARELCRLFARVLDDPKESGTQVAEESFAKRLIMLEEELRRQNGNITHGPGHGSYTPAGIMASEEIRYQLTGVQAQETGRVFIEENYPYRYPLGYP